MPYLAFNGFVIQFRIVHESCHGVPSAPVDAFEIEINTAFLYGLFYTVIKIFQRLPRDRFIFFERWPLIKYPLSRWYLFRIKNNC